MLVLVVSHTHWDREWYHGLGRFRQRLVALVDELLDAPADARVPFLLDGQAIVLEDYLGVRPEREADLAAALREGRLEAGPWYVLADELIPGAESLVRNLLAGRRTLARLGAAAPPVLYSPDAFGHPAALPTLAAGFGLPVVVAWRGYGGRRWPPGDTARWRAPDGSAAVLHHLPPDGYEFGSSLPADDARAAARWQTMRTVLAPRARLGLMLVQNGADHHALQRDATAALAALARAAAPHDEVRRTTLAEVVRAIADRAARTAGGELPEVTGELRDSYGYTWTLPGTLATRAGQKRRVAHAERALVRDVEPWLALSPLRADASATAALHAAWRTLLACLPHDTLCGCATDAVAAAMEARLASVAEQARGLRADALDALVGHDAAAARERRDDWRPVLVVRNATARPRGGVAEVELLTFLADEPVGPGSCAPTAVPPPQGVAVDGGRVPVQPLRAGPARHRVESPRHYPDNDLVWRTRGLAWVPAVPAYGVAAYPVDAGAVHAAASAPPHAAHAGARGGVTVLENGHLAVAIHGDGRVELRTDDGRVIADLLGLEDVGDVGDTYTHSPVGDVLTAARCRGARVVAGGPLRATVELRLELRVPARRTRRRAAPPVPLPIRVRLSLDAGAPFLRVAVRGVNRARDHRLRLVLRTGVADAAVFADAAFGPVRREPIVVPPDDLRMERPVRTAPLHRYVSLTTSRTGATVYADGLAEYEATPAGDVAVTLVRAIGALSRAHLPERPGHAGWPVRTPAAQCLGRFAGRFALLLHGPRDEATIDLVERVADDVLLPLCGTTLRSALALPPTTHGVGLEGDGLAVSAIKPAEQGSAIVLRCVNLLDRPVTGAWRLPPSVVHVRRARLDETPIEPLPLTGGRVEFTARPREVVTVLAEPRSATGRT
ncbi:MAG TPA: glycosyl hydrolase-related protein, partial [Gemmatimonadaceae bacterium]|nr:glycosyl hydrolase-related protein [Gemmatimonadaceae bacterium]